MEFVIAIGLVLVIEGLVYALFPAQLQKMMALAQRVSPGELRFGGVAALALGVLIVWIAKG